VSVFDRMTNSPYPFERISIESRGLMAKDAAGMRICPECNTRYSGAMTYCPRDGALLEEVDRGTQPLYDPYVGEILDERYRIQAPLGETSLAIFYAALQEMIDRRVTVKILRPEFATIPSLVEKFLAEAKLASKTDHPNLVRVTDFGSLADGAAYLVMDFLDGGSLGALLRQEGVLQPRRAANLMMQVARGMQAAHDHGMVHRNLNPDTILITRSGAAKELVKILDFGAASLADNDRHLTKTGFLAGNPAYMAPEQARGDTVGPAADIYSAGVILYELVTGVLPFQSDSFMGLLGKHIHEPVPNPVRFRSDLAGWPLLLRCIDQALRKEPVQRFSSMAEFAEALEQVSNEPAPVPHQPDRHEKPVPSNARVAGAKPTEQPTAARPVPTRQLIATAILPKGRSERSRLLRFLTSPSVLWGLVALLAGFMAGLLVLKTGWLTEDAKTSGHEGRAAAANVHEAVEAGTSQAKSESNHGEPGQNRALQRDAARRTSGPGRKSASQATTKLHQIHLRVVSRPAGATVFVDRRRMGRTPLDERVGRDGLDHTVRLNKPGFRSYSGLVRFAQPIGLDVTLERLPMVGPGAAGRGRPGRPSRPSPGELKNPWK